MQHLELTVVVYARDFTRSVEFYKRGLMLEEIDSWDRDESQGARFLVRPGAVIEVFGSPGDGIDLQTRLSGLSLGISTDDVASFHEHLKRKGSIAPNRQMNGGVDAASMCSIPTASPCWSRNPRQPDEHQRSATRRQSHAIRDATTRSAAHLGSWDCHDH